jgi:twitching motility protein PilT
VTLLQSGQSEPDARPREEVSHEDVYPFHVNELLTYLVQHRGSDLHLSAGSPPGFRVNGELHRANEYPELRPRALQVLIYSILSQGQRERFEEMLELDTSHTVPGAGRFRVNVLKQRGSLGAVFRHIPFEILSAEQLGIPPVVAGFADLPRGLVLVTGPTGSGKSTTLAAVLDLVNQRRASHIVTVEDPIEFLHPHKRSLVDQREVGADTKSFADALKHVLRQDPDVILVGELRDLETISSAITAAETGHLVLGTLHTQDAPQAIDRMIDVFPTNQQQQVRMQLAASIQGIVTQQLLKRSDGRGRVAAVEVLVGTPAVRNLIREGKTHQIYSAMQAGANFGMQTMDAALVALVGKRAITMAEALSASSNPDEIRRLSSSGGGYVGDIHV